MAPDQPVLRVARLEDAEGIQSLMHASARALFPHFYDARQSASAVRHVAQVDRALLADGTYYVIACNGELVACGGWSRRDRLYSGSAEAEGESRMLDPATEPAKVRAMFVLADWTRRGLGRRILDACERDARLAGFQQLSLMATLNGVPLYAACGFRELEQTEIVLSDGVTMACVSMEKPIRHLRSRSSSASVESPVAQDRLRQFQARP